MSSATIHVKFALPEPGAIEQAEIPAALSALAALQSALAVRLMNGTPAPVPVPPESDRMLTVDEAAALLRRRRTWIYRHAATLPFVKRISRKSLLCSEAGIKRWLAGRRG